MQLDLGDIDRKRFVDLVIAARDVLAARQMMGELWLAEEKGSDSSLVALMGILWNALGRPDREEL